MSPADRPPRRSDKGGAPRRSAGPSDRPAGSKGRGDAKRPDTRGGAGRGSGGSGDARSASGRPGSGSGGARRSGGPSSGSGSGGSSTRSWSGDRDERGTRSSSSKPRPGGPRASSGERGASGDRGGPRAGGSGVGRDSRGGGRPERGGEDRGPELAGPKKWGSLGRRGAGRLGEDRIDARNAAGAVGPDTRPDPRNEKIKWERVDDEVRGAAGGAVKRGRSKTEGGQGPQAEGRGRPADRGRPTERSGIKSRRGRAPREAGAGSGGARVKDELVKALGPPKGNRANERVRDAAHAFERERFDDARILLRPVAEQAPQAPSVRELLGLTYYRLGKWSDAVRELSAFREITKSSEQNPVLADAQRALKRHMEVEALWDELREDSPSPELVTEGRIVMAGSLSDRGKFAEAITLLEKSQRSVKNPKPHHLRQGYVLADIYERVGDVARARELFRWIVTHDPMFADAAERVGSLT